MNTYTRVEHFEVVCSEELRAELTRLTLNRQLHLRIYTNGPTPGQFLVTMSVSTPDVAAVLRVLRKHNAHRTEADESAIGKAGSK